MRLAEMLPLHIGPVAVRHTPEGLYSLNDMHAASGGGKAKQASNFMRRRETTEIIAEIANSSDLRSCVRVEEGRLAAAPILGVTPCAK